MYTSKNDSDICSCRLGDNGLLKQATLRHSYPPWKASGMDQPLSIWTLFIFISPAQIHCTSAHSTSTAHICWRWAVLPFADQTFRFIFKTCSNLHRVFTPEDLFFTCIALRWLNSWLFLETSGSSSNFNQPHKWSGILKCFSLQKGVFSFRINEWTRSCISLPPSIAHHPPYVYKKARFPYADWIILITWP